MLLALTISLVLLAASLLACVVLLRQKNQAQGLLDTTRGLLHERETEAAVLRQKHENDEHRMSDLRQHLTDFKQQLDTHLKALAGDALKESNTQFLQLAEQKLKPLRDTLQQYDQQQRLLEQSRKQDYGSLKQVAESLNDQTRSLVSALRRPEVRGRWGEIALQRIAELAGMTDRCDFFTQATAETDEGRRRPDMIVHLPNGRTVVVDSKVPLDAFLDTLQKPEGPERSALLERHAEQVRKQVNNLSTKAYASQFDAGPDFVVLFIPIESALYAAMDADPSLLEWAMERKIVVATPTLLIALLKAVEMGWHERAVAENADKLRQLGQELHERLSKSLADVAKVGDSLGDAVRSYNVLVGSLESRVLPSARKFEQAGARSAKELPANVDPINETPRALRTTHASTEA